MTEYTIQDVLSAICSEVEPLSSNDFQDIYRLKDLKEARLAYDVLNMLGFEIKFYNADDHARLYVTRPASDAALAKKLSAAITYAGALKRIKDVLGDLAAASNTDTVDYTLHLIGHAEGPKIAISLLPQAAPEPIKTESAPPLPASGSARPAQARRPGRKPSSVVLQTSGSELAKTYLMKKNDGKQEYEKDAFWRWMYSNIFRHFAGNSVEILFFLIVTLVLFSLGVMSKGFICPDLATTAKDTRWYCDPDKIRDRLQDITENPVPPAPLRQ